MPLVHSYCGTVPAAQPAGSAQGGVAADRGLVQFRCGGLLSLRSHRAACLRGALTRSGSGACVSSVESVAVGLTPRSWFAFGWLWYLAFRCLLPLVLLRHSKGFKELEIVVLRHQLSVLLRQLRRPPLRSSDRLFLAAASRLLRRPR